ncbi:MAG: type V CRISPR-associated protein Cas12a/Cpf1 [Bacteroidales bacterium]|jgi:hypothetical protein|nr:type V CRISPR-associated protein Cas12a/Cpf1 [Bacteroidales bacterium]
MKQFTNLYQLSKTLRFELIPQGKTLENIQASNILSNDEHRAESYKLVKKIIDEYHKNCIEKSLSGLKLDEEDLRNYFLYFNIKNKDESQKKAFEAAQAKLRKQIAKAFDTKRLFGKELIKEDLLNFDFVKQDATNTDLVMEFKDFTTYFTGFHENRKNMYSDEDKSTAIAFRLIHDNLPKFIGNMTVFEKINEPLADKLQILYTDFEEYLNVEKIADLFKLDYYSNVLTQTQIEVYNLLIGGKTLEDGTKIQGLNEYVNLYNQQQKDKTARLPKFIPLFKQILSDRDAISWLPEMFESDNQVLENIEKVYQEIPFAEIKSLIEKLSDYDLSKIYLRNDTGLTDISQKQLGHWSEIAKVIEAQLKSEHPKTARETEDKYNEKITKLIKNADSFSIAYLNECVKNRSLSEVETPISLQNYFKLFGKTEEQKDLFLTITKNYEEIKELLNTNYYSLSPNSSLKQDKQNVEKIKQFLDSIKALQWFIKPLKSDDADKDAAFYAEFEKLWLELDKITPLYNMVRNYVTQKPYSTEKIKLNFENSTLADGWDVNKEHDNTTIILRKDGLYYLAILNKNHKKVLDKEVAETDGVCFEKMEYKLLPGANKMLPKVFFSKSRISEFSPSKQLLENYEKGTHKKGENFNPQDCRTLIDFFKTSINEHEDWKHFDFHFSDTSTYQDLSGFYREVEQQGYKITFRNISENYINQLVEDGKLYLFQIYNKDFSPYSKGKGTPNMHTLYWKELFSPENLANVVYKLNGQAEVFYRKHSLNYNEETWKKGHHYDKLKDKFNYPIISKRRYALDKFQFHVPITMNFKAIGNERINEQVNQYIKDNGVKHIIGIDRGERHLLYLSLIDLNGKIVQQFSLNEIVNEYNGNTYKTDYHKLLDSKETSRDEARKSWNEIETIKELKEGYLSQVIYKIATMMVEYNAIVVLEDLNFGFMRGRQKVEKQVYQKFEKMLIDKLNYLVDKKKQPTEEGALLNAYQLTNKFTSFRDMGKQNGFLFYIPAWNTSKMDPVTGFVNLFDTRYENVDKAKDFFKKFEAIRYNKTKNFFEFVVNNYGEFNAKAADQKEEKDKNGKIIAKEIKLRQNWTICTYGDRIITFRNAEKNSQWDNKEVNLTKEFDDFFAAQNIAFQNGEDLKAAIATKTDKDFFEKLLSLFKLTLQMRNSITNSTTDYLISPVADENGNFYDSRKADDTKPKDADANGAYNIARKGLWAIEQIKNADDLKKINLAISNKEWLRYVQL